MATQIAYGTLSSVLIKVFTEAKSLLSASFLVCHKPAKHVVCDVTTSVEYLSDTWLHFNSVQQPLEAEKLPEILDRADFRKDLCQHLFRDSVRYVANCTRKRSELDMQLCSL